MLERPPAFQCFAHLDKNYGYAMTESDTNGHFFESNRNSGGLERLQITIVSHIFHPDELGGAALMTDLALFLHESGAKVNVVSTFPYYPRWRLSAQDRGVWRRTDRLA